MSFDLENYKKTKNEVIEKIKINHPDWEKTEGFIADGLINPTQYNVEDVKIICLLCESYGWSKNKVVNIENQRRPERNENESDDEYKKRILDADLLGLLPQTNNNNKAVETTRNITACLWLLYESLKNNQKVDFSEFESKKMKTSTIDNNILLQKTLEKIGWINVKKISRDDGKTQNDTEIMEHFEMNKEILQLQVQSTSPNLIIALSEPVKKFLQNNTNFLDYEIIFISHPSVWWSYKDIYEKFNQIYDKIIQPN
jgi:hypothetical protein